MANDRDKTSKASYYDKSREEIAQLNAYEQAMIAANKGRVPTIPTPIPAPTSEAVSASTPDYDEYVRKNMKNAGAAAYEQGKAEISGLDRVVTPAPMQEQTTPVQPVTTSPYQDFAKLWQKPITPEEEARRERAARAVQGVAGLGNLMSAFANLTFTGNGAPSQTLPTQSVDAMSDKMTSWKDKLKAEREKYQAAELGAKVEQWKMAQDERRYADSLKQQGIENELKLGSLEISRAKLAHDMDYAKQMLDLRAKELIQNGTKADRAWEQALAELGLKREQLKLSREELAARKDGSYYSGGGSGSSKWTPVSTHAGNMEIDYSKLNGVNLAQYAKRLEENGDDELSKAIAALGDGKESTEQLRQKIGKALTNPANAWLVEDMTNKGLLRNVGASNNGAANGWNPDNENDSSPIKKKK